MSDVIYKVINDMTAIILDPTSDHEERVAASNTRREAILMLNPEIRDGRPVITEKMAEKMDPFFPPEPDL